MARSPLTRVEASHLGAVDEASEAAREVEEQRQATEQERRLARRVRLSSGLREKACSSFWRS